MSIRAESVEGGTPRNHRGRGGSIPASALFFHAGEYDEAERLVLKHHYSHRMASNVQFVGTLWRGGGLFSNKGECVAAAIFTIPPTRWGEPCWELSRLVRAEQRLPLTMLISLSLRAIRKTSLCDLIVSFADRTQNHEGYVYRAANWNYGGLRERQMDGVMIDGRFVPGRSANSAYGTRSPSRLAERHGIVAEPHYDEGKHLYWVALNRCGAAKAFRLGLKTLERKGF